MQIKEQEPFRIIENSFVARIACWYMRGKAIAIVFGKGIHIFGVNKTDFLKDKRWLEHELEHIRQYKKYGFFKFLFLYLVESIKKGYYNNRFEVEARRAADQKIPNDK